MGMSAVQYKLMPAGVDEDLDKIKVSVTSLLDEFGGILSGIVEEPVAFGLKALVVSFAFPEEKEIDNVGNAFLEIDGVSSAEMVDYRRALG